VHFDGLFFVFIIEYKICVLIFSTNISLKVSNSKKKWAIYDIKYISVFM